MKGGVKKVCQESVEFKGTNGKLFVIGLEHRELVFGATRKKAGMLTIKGGGAGSCSRGGGGHWKDQKFGFFKWDKTGMSNTGNILIYQALQCPNKASKLRVKRGKKNTFCN